MAGKLLDSMRTRLTATRLAALLLASSVVQLTGCLDGPLFQMKKLSPWHQHQWRKDRELGPTFSQRLQELQLLKSQVRSMPADQQEQWATLLEKMIREEKSPDMRSQCIQTLALIKSDTAIRGLTAASTDEVEKVRLAACHAWGEIDNEQARNMLLNLAGTDDSDDVRQAALASLGKFNDQEVRGFLAETLDNKNPAIQQQAVVSLRKMTGRDYGGDFDAWKRYVGGEDVAQPPPESFTARVLDSVPWLK